MDIKSDHNIGLLRWWWRHWLKYSLGLAAIATLAMWLLRVISLVGAPDLDHWIGFNLIAQLVYAIMVALDVFFGKRLPHGSHQFRADLWQVGFRLMAGLALFPVICVLFLNRSKI